MARSRPGKLRCGCDPLCAACSGALRALVAALRDVLAEEVRVQMKKRDLYREARGLGLPMAELKRRAGADGTRSQPSRKKAYK